MYALKNGKFYHYNHMDVGEFYEARNQIDLYKVVSVKPTKFYGQDGLESGFEYELILATAEEKAEYNKPVSDAEFTDFWNNFSLPNFGDTQEG